MEEKREVANINQHERQLAIASRNPKAVEILLKFDAKITPKDKQAKKGKMFNI